MGDSITVASAFQSKFSKMEGQAEDSQEVKKSRISELAGISYQELKKKIKIDNTLGMDALYRVKLKQEDTDRGLRIIAPFVEFALNPPKEYKQHFVYSHRELSQFKRDNKVDKLVDYGSNVKATSFGGETLHISNTSIHNTTIQPQTIFGNEALANNNLVNKTYNNDLTKH